MNVKIFLRDLFEPVVDAWRVTFEGCSDVEISCGDLFELKADAIISPANSFGFMDGGIDLAYSKHFGWSLQKKLQTIIRNNFFGELPVGNAVVIKTGDSNIKHLISAPTMRLPQDISKTENAYLAFRAALIEIVKFNKGHNNKIKSVLCPGLGTSTGALPPMVCATQMRRAYDLISRESCYFPKSLSEAYTNI